MKTCNQCKEKKSLKCFYKEVKSKDGLRGKCITCFNLYCKKRRTIDSEKIKNINKTWREKNPEKSKQCSNTYRIS